MAETPNVIRFDPHGPGANGLTEWERMDPAALVAGTPVQRGHVYDEEPAAGYLAGVWDCTAFTEHMGPYGVDEFMLLLEGKLVMGLPDGSEITLRQGDAFVIPKGLECQWRQPGYLRKYFMILDAPVPGGAENPALPRITVPDLAADLPAVGPGAAVESSRTDFVNAAGTLSVGVRHCAAASIPALPVRESMLVHVLAGRLTLTGGAEDGASAEFAAGETAYLRRGGVVGWRTDAGTRLLQSRYASP